MNAIVSGQAKTALLIDNKAFSSIHIDSPQAVKPRLESEFRFLFGGAKDLRFVRNIQQADVVNELQYDCDKASALNLALMLLDLDIKKTKALICDALNDLLDNDEIGIYLDSIFYAKPLPDGSDTLNALDISGPTFPKVFAWLTLLVQKQDDIAWVRTVWDRIPIEIFGDEEKRNEFQRIAVHQKIFRDLVLSRGDGQRINLLNINHLQDRLISSLPNFREVLKSLYGPFRIPTISDDQKRNLKEEKTSFSSPRQKEWEGFDRNAVRENVQSQIDHIIDTLGNRNLPLASKLMNELVDYQEERGEPIHAVKSLCQLAQNAKELGFFAFQLDLTQKAVDLVYSDAWTQNQYGDALLRNGKFDQALKAFDIALSFSMGRDLENQVFAKTGYAEVLKAQGKLGEALDIYVETMASHPENVVARNGYAEVLKAQGKLGEALDIYVETMASHPEDVVARSGYAEVLKAQGKLGEALNIYLETMASHPEDVFARNGYAEVLKAQGKLGEALDIYVETMASHPEDVVARNGYAGVLFYLGRYETALAVLPQDNLVTHNDWIGYHIRGMVMLRMGNLEEASSIFKKGIKEDPFRCDKPYFRGALGITYLQQEKFEETQEMLEQVTEPILQPAISLFRTHALGELRRFSEAQISFSNYLGSAFRNEIGEYKSQNALALALEIESRYVTNFVRNNPDPWLFQKETYLLMALAP